MDKMLVVLDRKDMVVKVESGSLRIERPGAALERVPLNMISQVIVYGSPLVYCNVWRAMADHNISAVLLPLRGSSQPAWLGAGISTSVQARLLQYQAWSDKQLKTITVCFLLQCKIKGLLNLLNLLSDTDKGHEHFPSTKRISKKNTNKIESILNDSLDKIDSNKSIDSLRGIEGSAAKAWFAFINNILDKRWKFKNRNRRPPRDPVNALLSLGYTLMMSVVQQEIQLRGLDPGLGFLHSVTSGRESLVLDIAEPLRPGVDAFVLSLLDNILKPAHFFSNSQDGCRLNKEGRGLFYSSWASWRDEWPVLLDRQREKGKKLNFICRSIINDTVNIFKSNSE